MASYRQRLAEEAVRDFPAIKRDYDGYRLMLEAKAFSLGSLFEERVDGGKAGCAADRFLDRFNDSLFRRLSALVLGIYEPFCKLPDDQRRVLALRFWRNMDVPDVAAELMFSERSVYRHTSRALNRLYRPVLEVQPLLEDWRAGLLK